jgi:hypothetical protein
MKLAEYVLGSRLECHPADFFARDCDVVCAPHHYDNNIFDAPLEWKMLRYVLDFKEK